MNQVSPAFLFALLLWPGFCHALVTLQLQGVQPEEAQRRAADRVTLHHLERVALPRRFFFADARDLVVAKPFYFTPT